MILAAVAASCAKKQPAPAAPPAPTRPAPATAPAVGAPVAKAAPEIPVDLDQDALESKILIKDNTVAQRAAKEKYRQDPRVPAGSIVGACFVPATQPVTVPPYELVEVHGSNEIKDPQKGEVEHYELNPPRQDLPLSSFDQRQKRFGVERTVLMVRGVTAGKRPIFNRPNFVVGSTGQMQVPERGYNYGAGCAGFGPCFDRIQLCSTEFFPCQVAIHHAESNKDFLETAMPGYQDPKFPGQRFGTNFGMAQPKIMQSPPVMEYGHYVLSCKRHPWQRADLFICDSPYVCMSGENGMFSLDDVPEGSYTVQVWHPLYEPEQTSFPVKVEASRKFELAVRFKAPRPLTEPTPMPDKPIEKWAFLGLMDRNIDIPEPPEKKLDFKLQYVGKSGSRIGWKTAERDPKSGSTALAAAAGAANTQQSSAYFASVLDSPKGGMSLLSVNVLERAEAWLNGAPVLSSKEFPRGQGLIPIRLRPGPNMLLVRAWCGGRGDGSLAVSYRSADATAQPPALR